VAHPAATSRRVGGSRAALATVVLLLLVAVLVPVLNLAIPADSAAHVPTWVVSLLGKYLAFALLALSVDLIWGYCGILSLGHGTFFALGGYAVGMHLMREIGGRGTLHGAILGAILVNYLKTWFTGTVPELWLFGLGGLFIIVTLFLPKGVIGVLGRRPRGDTASDGLAAAPMGGDGAEAGGMMHSHARPERHDTILYLDGVSVSFDGFKALDGLSLYVKAGELRAIIGPNGAGKTTMMDVVTGKTKPGLFQRRGRPDKARRGADRQSRHRPQVSETHRVREPHGARQPGAAGGRRPRRAAGVVLPPVGRATRADRRRPKRRSRSAASATGGPACCPTDRTSGWKSACC
jgi:ABC-type multidrug transport system fused ATPase/permease subunit